MKYFAKVNDHDHEVEVIERLGELLITVDGKPIDLKYHAVDEDGQIALQVGQFSYGASIDGGAHECALTIAGSRYRVEIEDERERAAAAAARAKGGGGDLKSVMPGVVVQIFVKPGDEVQEGQSLLILEAMKMQNEIDAPVTGTVDTIYVTEGQAVAGAEKLLKITAAPE